MGERGAHATGIEGTEAVCVGALQAHLTCPALFGPWPLIAECGLRGEMLQISVWLHVSAMMS